MYVYSEILFSRRTRATWAGGRGPASERRRVFRIRRARARAQAVGPAGRAVGSESIDGHSSRCVSILDGLVGESRFPIL